MITYLVVLILGREETGQRQGGIEYGDGIIGSVNSYTMREGG